MQAGTPAGRGVQGGRLVALVAGVAAVLLLVGIGGVILLGQAAHSNQSGARGGARQSRPAPTDANPLNPNGQQDPNDPFGGGANPPLTTPSPTYTKPATGWTVPVNSYCRTVDLQLKAVPSAATREELAASLRKQAEIIKVMNDKLRAMTVPAANQADYQAMLAAWDQLPTGYSKAADAALANDADTYRQVMAATDASNAKGNDIANRMGLTDCADAGGIPDNGPTPSSSVI